MFINIYLYIDWQTPSKIFERSYLVLGDVVVESKAVAVGMAVVLDWAASERVGVRNGMIRGSTREAPS